MPAPKSRAGDPGASGQGDWSYHLVISPRSRFNERTYLKRMVEEKLKTIPDINLWPLYKQTHTNMHVRTDTHTTQIHKKEEKKKHKDIQALSAVLMTRIPVGQWMTLSRGSPKIIEKHRYLQFITVAQFQLWSSNERILWFRVITTCEAVLKGWSSGKVEKH